MLNMRAVRTRVLVFLGIAGLVGGCVPYEEPEKEDEVMSSSQGLITDSLDFNRNRLFASWAARKGYGSDVCRAWNALPASAKGVFLSITHRLQISRLVRTGRPALDHVESLLSIRGMNGSSCGGGEWNRLFFTIDNDFFLANWYTLNSTQFVDVWGNRDFRQSGDAAGPHDPFVYSNETVYGSPRGQTHFFGPYCNTDYGCPSQTPICRVDLNCEVTGAYTMEMDQDYNWVHDSSTECWYGSKTGRMMYEEAHPAIAGLRDGVNWNWTPNCGGGGGGGEGTLSANQSLTAGESVSSPDGRFHFTYQGDGNLVLYQDGVGVLWASNTGGTSAGRTIMQGDGNLVIYDGSDQAVWSSGTNGNPGAFLRVQNDGNVVLYSSGGSALWNTGTCCR